MSEMFELAVPWWEIVLRGSVIYVVLLVLIRLSGKRTVGQFTPFDLMVLVLLGDAVQGSMLGGDQSLQGGLILAATLLGWNRLMGLATSRSEVVAKLVEGTADILARNGEVYEDALKAADLTLDDLQEAMRDHSVAALSEIRLAVLEKDGKGAQLCLGAIASSLPPQCSGLPLVGWDWARVEGEQTAQTTTWGEYHLVGTFDGTRFTPTQPPGPPQPPVDDMPKITTPCPEPAGGWQRPQPKRTGHEWLEKASAAAQTQPDFAGLWIHDPNPPVGEGQDMQKIILNVAFTGDLERHTKELRKHWGGALCVVQHARTEAELIKIQEAAQKTIGELGLVFLGSMTDIVTGVVRIDVVSADASHQAKLDERHGAGAVIVSPRLRPAP